MTMVLSPDKKAAANAKRANAKPAAPAAASTPAATSADNNSKTA
jgi:hypothetical protein